MKDITIVGAGVAGFILIEKIREKDNQCKITLIDKNTDYFCKKELIAHPAELGKRVELRGWANERGVEFINDTLERINIRRRKIYLKTNEAKEFDTLVIATGLNSKKLPIKGDHREGFFYFSQTKPLALKDLLRISSEACIFVSTLLGIKLALALISLEKEVRIVSSGLDFLGENKEEVINFLQEKGIVLHLESSIEEAVGEGMIKAVKISPLKVFSSQLVFVDSGFSPNLNFFEEEIKICDTFFTNYEKVYLLGDVNRSDIEKEILFTNNYQEVKQQASCFCDYLLEAKAPGFQRKTDEAENIQKAVGALLNENKVVENI